MNPWFTRTGVRMKNSSTDPEPRQSESACADLEAAEKELATDDPAKVDLDRGRVYIRLGALGPRLRTLATLERTSVSALMRRAAVQMLRDRPVEADEGGNLPRADRSQWVRVHLSLPQAHSDELAVRARAADMSRSEFVWSLLQGKPPPPVPADFTSAVRCLHLSTDQVAALSTDLSVFLRLLEKASTRAPELQPFRESLRTLREDVREHLKRASTLLAALEPYRRPRP